MCNHHMCICVSTHISLLICHILYSLILIWRLHCAFLLIVHVLYYNGLFYFVDNSFPGYAALTYLFLISSGIFCVSFHCFLVTLICKEKIAFTALLFPCTWALIFLPAFEMWFFMFVLVSIGLTVSFTWFMDCGLVFFQIRAFLVIISLNMFHSSSWFLLDVCWALSTKYISKTVHLSWYCS